MKPRLEVLCEGDTNTIFEMSEEGIRNLGEFEISGDNVIYRHLDKDVAYTLGVFYKNSLRCIKPEDCNEKGMTFKIKGRCILYIIDKKPRYLLNIEKAHVIEVE